MKPQSSIFAGHTNPGPVQHFRGKQGAIQGGRWARATEEGKDRQGEGRETEGIPCVCFMAGPWGAQTHIGAAVSKKAVCRTESNGGDERGSSGAAEQIEMHFQMLMAGPRGFFRNTNLKLFI